MSTHDLEAERRALLARMQANREQFRRMLMDQPEVKTYTPAVQGGQAAHEVTHEVPHGARYENPQYSGHYDTAYNYAATGTQSPGMMALQWMKQHPFLCAAAVAAVVAIGPRRIARTAMASGTAVGAVTMRNQANINMITRLVSQLANTYMQNQQRTRYRP